MHHVSIILSQTLKFRFIILMKVFRTMKKTFLRMKLKISKQSKWFWKILKKPKIRRRICSSLLEIGNCITIIVNNKILYIKLLPKFDLEIKNHLAAFRDLYHGGSSLTRKVFSFSNFQNS